MKRKKVLRPGDPAPAAGLYQIIDVDGTPTDVIYRIKKKGTMLPPTYRKGQTYIKLKSGEGPRRKAA